MTLYGLAPKIAIVLSCAILVIISGTRVDVGVDHQAYVQLFKEINQGYSSFVESGFMWLNKTIGFFTGDAQWLFFVSSLLTIELILSIQFVIRKHGLYSENISFASAFKNAIYGSCNYNE